MNAFFFFSAVALMLGGGGVLQFTAGQRGRTAATSVVLVGIAVLAGGLGAWAFAVLYLLAGAFLFVSPVLRRRYGSYRRAGGTGPVDWRKHGSVSDGGEGGTQDPNPDSEAGSGSSLRKGFAALLSAALAGILLSVIWSNPLWKIKTLSGQELPVPGSGAVLLGLLLAFVAFFSVASKKGRRVSDSQTAEAELLPETGSADKIAH